MHFPKFEPKDILPLDESAPEPRVRSRRTYVTPDRMLKFGCEQIAAGSEAYRHIDACHERLRKLLEDEDERLA